MEKDRGRLRERERKQKKKQHKFPVQKESSTKKSSCQRDKKRQRQNEDRGNSAQIQIVTRVRPVYFLIWCKSLLFAHFYRFTFVRNASSSSTSSSNSFRSLSLFHRTVTPNKTASQALFVRYFFSFLLHLADKNNFENFLCRFLCARS